MGKYESPEYKIIEKEDEFEVREYVDFYTVEYDNIDDPEIAGGFRTLFKYISSDNVEKEKINMTVPVIEEVTHEKKKMAFVVPGKFADNIPVPKNKNLKVKKFTTGLFGAIRYSGSSNEFKEEKMKKKLYEWIESRGYEKNSSCMLAFYNPPFVPPMFRRNEILVRIVKKVE